jgi:hypothetical protein
VFVSDPYEEVITIEGKVDPNYKSWPRVDTSETFYQVHTKPQNARNITSGVVLLATPDALIDFLEICRKSEERRIEQILLTTPPHANHSRLWRTETLVKLEVRIDQCGLAGEILYHTASGCYREERVYGKGGGELSTIYKSRKRQPGEPR